MICGHVAMIRPVVGTNAVARCVVTAGEELGCAEEEIGVGVGYPAGG